MATTSTTRDLEPQPLSSRSTLISLPAFSQDALQEFLAKLDAALPGSPVLVATPDTLSPDWTTSQQRLIPYAPAILSTSPWILTAADLLNARDLATTHSADCVLILGPEAQTIDVASLRNMLDTLAASDTDLVVPRYTVPPLSGLVNSAILYPLSRALFGEAPRFPLAPDLGVSSRMLERLTAAAQKFTPNIQPEALVWPVAEAAVANFSVKEVPVASRTLPQPGSMELNTLLAQVAGSLFADIDSKAAFWQRTRIAPTAHPSDTSLASDPPSTDDLNGMIQAFRLAYGNLAEIWSLVLPPQSLLGLKRLSVAPPESFLMPDSLWARTVYDFLLAYRLRTINRGHLLGALTPLYLAWVASHLRRAMQGQNPESLVESLAIAFETDKPYLVSRWRWPDRFNP